MWIAERCDDRLTERDHHSPSRAQKMSHVIRRLHKYWVPKTQTLSDHMLTAVPQKSGSNAEKGSYRGSSLLSTEYTRLKSRADLIGEDEVVILAVEANASLG